MKSIRYIKRFGVVMAVALVAIGALAGAAFAADTSALLTGGTLNISTALTGGTFAGTLTGAAQVLDATPTGGGTVFGGFSINDPRGTGVGWNVTMQATQFINGAVRTATDDIALNALTMPLLAVATADAGSSAVPGTLQAAATIDTGTTGVVMAACSANGQGMGTYDFTAAAAAPWQLALTADEYAGTYTSTVTTTLATLALAP